jgi:hypothetical protein
MAWHETRAKYCNEMTIVSLGFLENTLQLLTRALSQETVKFGNGAAAFEETKS